MIAQMKPNLTSDQILHSLNTQELLIFTGGSCSPNPGPEECAIVVSPSNNQPRQDFEFHIYGIFINVACEIVEFHRHLKMSNRLITNRIKESLL